ncbi:hypothetical protein BC938DRAFT_473589 [Jimgerdemannia flammicorona]|uniref:Uncharacterized protein n=1 Tax=Jimgerdemannia flammicorona TaxID=994334 RepID=A0A433Q3X0_9FUNG|nr:hypothetical protein BC938DRAFT_473589 [Jimgerdemannia flammicorona]
MYGSYSHPLSCYQNTSAINGALTRMQIQQSIADSIEIYNDTAQSVCDLLHSVGPDGSIDLCHQDKFSLDLLLMSYLGGHSHTHCGKEKFPGMTISYVLMEMLEERQDHQEG